MVNTASITSKVMSALLKVGGHATFHVQQDVDYDSTSGKVDASTSRDVTAVTSPPVSWRDFYKSSQSSMGESSSVFVLAAKGLTFTPAKGMLFTYAGTRWKINQVEPQMLLTTILAYTLEVSLG